MVVCLFLDSKSCRCGTQSDMFLSVKVTPLDMHAFPHGPSASAHIPPSLPISPLSAAVVGEPGLLNGFITLFCCCSACWVWCIILICPYAPGLTQCADIMGSCCSCPCRDSVPDNHPTKFKVIGMCSSCVCVLLKQFRRDYGSHSKSE